MGDLTATILAAEEGGGTSNFLLPNGTFFVVLIIFLIVLGVIGTFVVPPISKVLRERDEMIAKTVEDNRRIADRIAATDADYDKAMAQARKDASAIRDQARGEGRKIVEDMRARASAEASTNAGERRLPSCPGRARQPRPNCRPRWSRSPRRWPAGYWALTSRGHRRQRGRGGSGMSTFIGQLVGFALIVFLVWKYVVPPVRNMMKTRQDTVRTQLEDSAEATKKLAQAEAEHKKALGRGQGRDRQGSRGIPLRRREDRRTTAGPGRQSRSSESRCRAASRWSC